MSNRETNAANAQRQQRLFKPPKSHRKQFQSCDRCRRARRACDAVSNGINPFSSSRSLDQEGGPKRTCTGCHRVGKPCTFEWLRKLPDHCLPSCFKQQFDRSSGVHGFSSAAWNATFSSTDAGGSEVTFANVNSDGPRNESSPGNSSSTNAQHHSSPDSRDLYLGLSLHSGSDSLSWLAESIISPHDVDGAIDASVLVEDPTLTLADSSSGWQHSPTTGSVAPIVDDLVQTIPSSYSFGHSGQFGDATSSFAVLPQRPSRIQQDTSDDRSCPTSRGSEDDASNQANPLYHSAEHGSFMRRRTIMGFDPEPYAGTFAPYETNLARNTCKHSVTDTLIEVYSGSFENAMACWVTPETCPYNSQRLTDGPLRPTTRTSSPSSSSSIPLFRRAQQVDRAFSSLRQRPMSSRECQLASKSLQLTIMAFASQWTPQRTVSPRSNSALDGLGNSIELERLMHRSLWNEARSVLDQCLETDSVRVSFAHILFAMIKPPSDYYDDSRLFEERPYDRYGMNGDLVSLTDAASNAARHLKAAMRPLQMWRRKLDSVVQSSPSSSFPDLSWIPRQSHHSTTTTLPEEVLDSFNLLFWLGVMRDTVSAGLYHHPLTLTDAQTSMRLSAVHESRAMPLTAQPTSGASLWEGPGAQGHLWGPEILSGRRSVSETSVIRWPCHPDLAEKVIQNSLLVEVLLWRKVAHLQALRRHGASLVAIHRCVHQAVQVYYEWQTKYANLFQDCARNHPDLPLKTQSWYAVLGVHWHRACLFLARDIESLHGVLNIESAHTQAKSPLVVALEIRKSSCYAVSDLFATSFIGPQACVHKWARENPAFVDGALLTEPWSDVQTETLVTVSQILLSWLHIRQNARSCQSDSQANWLRHNTSSGDIMRDLTGCIQALELLGHKVNGDSRIPMDLRDGFNSLEGRGTQFEPTSDLLGTSTLEHL